MPAPVWVLSVDLQTKTATFQSGLGDAAKSARGAFADIKQGSGEMGREVSGNMMEARHGVILLGEEFGVHLPRGVTSFLASIGPVGAAMEAAFPFLAIAVGATILIEHLAKMHEAGEKLTEDQAKFGVTVNGVFNHLDEKLIQAEIRSDELKNDHLGALALQLELIDKQSMEELLHSFDEIAKASDVVMKGLTGSWYTWGKGSEGAKHALDEFQNSYTQLLSSGKDADADKASGLLHGTLSQAEKTLSLLQQIQTAGRSNAFGAFADPAKFHEAEDALNKMGVAHGETVQKQIEAQQRLVGVLNSQLGAEERIADAKAKEGANATSTTARTMSAEQSSGARASADSQQRIAALAVAADKATADAQLTIRRASIQERLAVDLDFANREYAVQVAGNAAQIAALDKLAPAYTNTLKALHEKAAEEAQQHANVMAALTDHALVEQSNKDLKTIETGEREKIESTVKGSTARLAAIDAAIKEEQALNMTDLDSFRSLQKERAALVQQMTEESRKLEADAGREAAENATKIGELLAAAEKTSNALRDSAQRTSAAQRVQQEKQVSNEEFAVKLHALADEAAALDKSGLDYNNKLKAIQDKETQLVLSHENEIAQIKEKAEEQSNARILSAANRFTDQISSGLTKVLMGHESFTKMMDTLGSQVVSSMIENSIKIMLQQDKERLSDARKAAASAYTHGEAMGPAGVVLGPVFAAAAFAGVMAFHTGGVVPGVGSGDTVPAMLEPGEGVMPKALMEAAKGQPSGGNGGNHYAVHVRPTYNVQTIDGDGMQDALDKHTDVLTKHFENTVRKMNK